MTKERFIEMVAQIMDDMPLSLDNETDGRYTWPRRWVEFCSRIETEIGSEE